MPSPKNAQTHGGGRRAGGIDQICLKHTAGSGARAALRPPGGAAPCHEIFPCVIIGSKATEKGELTMAKDKDKGKEKSNKPKLSIKDKKKKKKEKLEKKLIGI